MVRWDFIWGHMMQMGRFIQYEEGNVVQNKCRWIKEKFSNYESFAKATLDNILEGKMDHTVVKRVTEFKNGFLLMRGKMVSNLNPFQWKLK